MSTARALLLLVALGCAGCAPVPASAPPTTDSPPAPTASPVIIASPTREGWTTFLGEEIGFAFAFPDTGSLSPGTGATLATIAFPADPVTNVVEESISISGSQGEPTCLSPLAEGWAPGELSPETVDVNGVSFLRQTHSGVAAGTSSMWVAYTAQGDQRCVSLGYILRTFDPANLDPTRFPTPPVTVDVQQRIREFEAIVATFTWLG